MSYLNLKKILFLTILISFQTTTCRSQNLKSADNLSTWIRENAVSINSYDPGNFVEDLHPLKNLIKNKRIVCLGDSRHDAHEQFLMKTKIIKYLITKLDFDILVLEEGFTEAFALNSYLHTGEGNLSEILNGLGNWFVWDTQEFLELVDWLRSYNESQNEGDQVNIFGMDITSMYATYNNIIQFLNIVDPYYLLKLKKPDFLEKQYNVINWMQIMSNYSALSPKALDIINNFFDDLMSNFSNSKRKYIEISSKERYEKISLQLYNLYQAHKMYSVGLTSYKEGGIIREKAMSGNLQWILNSNPDKKIILWTHNVHIAKSSIDMYISGRPPTKNVKSLIQYLDSDISNKIFSLAFSSYYLRFPGEAKVPEDDMIDAIFNKSGNNIFLISLIGQYATGVEESLKSLQKMQSQGGFIALHPSECYDAVIFIREITPTIKSKNYLKKMDER